MIKAVIFDCFGVLVGYGFDNTYRRLGGDPQKDKVFIEDILNQANKGLISDSSFQRAICDRLGISAERYQMIVEETEQPNTELLAYIKKLKRDYKIGVLSNVNQGGLQEKLEKPIKEGYFDVLISSAETGYIKPQAEIYEYAAKQLSVVPNECIFIDDRPEYVEAAQAVGMAGVIYSDYFQCQQEIEKLLANSN